MSGTSAKPDRVDFGNWAAFLPDEAQVLTRGDWQQSGGKWVRNYTLIIFDSVNQIVPPLAVHLLSGDSVLTNPMQLAVMPVRVSGDLSELAPIRGLHAESLAWTDFALLVGGAFALGGIALFFINRKKRRARPTPPVQQTVVEKPADLPPPTPAHTLALQELARLGREKPWQKGNIKEYYAELSLIVRQYLEARYQISAPESTTREIEAMLRQTGFPKERMGDLRKILEQSDLAKYAQDLGSDRPHETYLLRSEEIIKQTADAP